MYVSFLAGFAVAASATGAFAFEQCEPFSVFFDHASVKRAYIDHGEEGTSVGDRRIIYRPLLNESGDLVGHYDAQGTAMHVSGDVVRLSGEVSLQFPGGAIIYKTLPTPIVRDFDDTTGGVATVDAPRIIALGSGVFAGASGNVELVRGNDRSELKINVSCP